MQELFVEIAVLKERLLGNDRALDLQATEYERRLDVLNHSHAEAKRVLDTYVTREIYEKDYASFDDRIKFVELWRSSLLGGSATVNYIGRALWALFGGLIVGAIALLLKIGLT